MKNKFPLLLVLLLTACGKTTPSSPSSSEIISPSSSEDFPPIGMEIDETNTIAMERNYKDYAINTYYPLDFIPSIGNPKILVIPLWFTDSYQYIFYPDNVSKDIEKAYFGGVGEYGWTSLKEFYKKESFGLCDLTGTIAPWYECGLPSTDFYNSGALTEITLKNAVEDYFLNHPEDDRKSYDFDQNGYLDGVMIIYGSPNHITLQNWNADNMWAYTSWLMDPDLNDIEKPGPNAYFWSSYDFFYSSGDKAISRAGTYYGYGDTSYCEVDSHTIIHEAGHMFGLSDYYDYAGSYSPGGGFSMQDHNVGGHDPYSLLTLNWTNAFIPQESCVVNLDPFQSSHDLILLTSNWNDINSPFDEYLLLEFYTPDGLNEFDVIHPYSYLARGPQECGVRLWHVDARLVHFPFSRSDFTRDPLDENGRVYHAFSNTSSGGSASILGPRYYKYNELQFIRNDINESYETSSFQTSSHLFKDKDSFTMAKFDDQFPGKAKMNTGSELGWEFDVRITGQGDNLKATINLVKVESDV